jgi:uncharacterized protein involved in oxidation of intracellular sulfur
MGDAAACARSGQKTPQGYYNVERMLMVVAQNRGEVGVCGSCTDARGLGEGELVKGTRLGSLEELADWSLWADRTLVF